MAQQAARPGKTVQQATDEALFGDKPAADAARAGPEIVYRPGGPPSPSSRSAPAQRAAADGAGAPGGQEHAPGGRSLITEMEARLPAYEVTPAPTGAEAGATAARGGGGGGSPGGPFTVVVSTPELTAKGRAAAVDLVSGGVLVSIEGCKELFVPLEGVHGGAPAAVGAAAWRARAKRSSKRGTLTVSVAWLPAAAV